MSDRSAPHHWNERYAGVAHWYGTEPNDFLRDHVAAIQPHGRVVSLAEGEGRNAVFLAQLGFEVTAVDFSSAGLAKAERLALERAVAVRTVLADLTEYALGRSTWDGIVSIWCHLPSTVRARVHREAVAALRPGGVLLLEAYTPAQIPLGTGGPRDPDLMPTLAVLRTELAGLDFEVAVEREREVREGSGHGGRSAVVQVVARRPR